MENLFETIFESAPDALVVVNSKGTIIMINKQVKKLFGYEKNELIGKPVEMLMPGSYSTKHESHREKYNQSPTEREMGVGLPLITKRKDGTEFYAEISLSPVRIENELYVSAAVRDVTEKKKLLEQLMIHEEQIGEQNSRLTNFAHIVSHNLRSYASNLVTMLSFLENAKTKQDKEEMMSHLKSISSALRDTIGHLTEVVSIQTASAIQKETINLKDYSIKTAEILSGEINAQGVILQNNIPSEIYVDYNPAYMESILLNFLSNSIKYRFPGRQPLITLDAFQEDKRLVLKISDNGRGIDLAIHGPKLFGMYSTFHGNPEARGIGLFITKNQVEAMGGKIEIESEVDQGTTFKVFLS